MSVASYASIPANNPGQIMAYLNRGVVSILVDASTAPFRYYRGGILSGSACGTTTDHAINVVGYGDGYFIIRNSWGTGWGEGGYARFAMQNGAGVCAMNSSPSQPYTTS